MILDIFTFTGGSISFFQSVCVLGYCLLPLALSLVLCQIVLLANQNTALFIVRYALFNLLFG